jgi:hypothetical protein
MVFHGSVLLSKSTVNHTSKKIIWNCDNYSVSLYNRKQHPKETTMTNQQINIAIAEHCGFNLEEYRMEEGGINVAALPDYCNDLNAMYEAEEVLTSNEWELWHRIIGDWDVTVARLTSHQRAESFLKTIGKWEGS